MKKRLRIIIPIVVILALVIYFTGFRNSHDLNGLKASGNIEVTDAQLGFRISGILNERPADEGDDVKADQLLAMLDDTDQRLKVAEAEAQVKYYQAILDELKAGSRPEEIEQAEAQVKQAQYALEELESGSRSQEIKEAQAALENNLAGGQSAEAQLELAANNYSRYKKLFENGSVSEREYDEFKTGFETAQKALEKARAAVQSSREKLSLMEEGPRSEQIKIARAKLQQAKAAYELVKKGPRRETIAQAEARLKVADETLKQAKQQLQYTELKAPFDGVILSKSAEKGEYLTPGSSVVSIAQLDKVWLRAYVNETALGKIKLNQEVEVKTDTYPDKKYKGIISYISDEAEFTPKSVQTFDERVKLMYRIKIELENTNRELKPGMPADAFFNGQEK